VIYVKIQTITLITFMSCFVTNFSELSLITCNMEIMMYINDILTVDPLLLWLSFLGLNNLVQFLLF
jgi:hypothetical protein